MVLSTEPQQLLKQWRMVDYIQNIVVLVMKFSNLLTVRNLLGPLTWMFLKVLNSTIPGNPYEDATNSDKSKIGIRGKFYIWFTLYSEIWTPQPPKGLTFYVFALDAFRIEGNRPRGRPPKRWSDCFKEQSAHIKTFELQLRWCGAGRGQPSTSTISARHKKKKKMPLIIFFFLVPGIAHGMS